MKTIVASKIVSIPPNGRDMNSFFSLSSISFVSFSYGESQEPNRYGQRTERNTGQEFQASQHRNDASWQTKASC